MSIVEDQLKSIYPICLYKANDIKGTQYKPSIESDTNNV
jgi:hypothetical protein